MVSLIFLISYIQSYFPPEKTKRLLTGLSGVRGAVAAALGMISPCLVIISLIAACLSNYHDNPMVRHALAGISACVAALIFDAVVALWKKGVKDVVGYALCFAMIGLTLWTDMNLILLVIAAGIIGIMLAPKKKEAKK